MTPYHSDGPTGAPPPAIYMRMPGDSPKERPLLDGLVEFFDLRVYGNCGLNGCARTAMRRGATLLAVAFVFDLMAWTILFTLIFHGGNFEISLLTPIAVLLAILLSIATLSFEATLFTADMSRWTRRTLTGLAGRLTLIGVFAVLTAQPIHVLLFDGPIQRRAQQEQAIEQALVIAHEITSSRQDVDALLSGEAPTGFELIEADQSKDAEQANARVAELEASISGAQATKARATKTMARAETQIETYSRRLASGGTDEERDLWAKRLEGNRAAYNKARAEAENAESELTQLSVRLGSAGKARESARTDLNDTRVRQGQAVIAAREKAKALAEHLRQFVSNIYNGAPGETITDSLTGRTFTARPYDFFERLRVLDDLCAGRLPRWPSGEVSQEELAVLKDELKLPTIPPGAEASDAQRTLWDRANDDMTREAVSLRVIWWVTQAIGMFVPLLTLLYKLMLPQDLTQYYSVAWQLQIGNPEVHFLDEEREPGAWPVGESSSLPDAMPRAGAFHGLSDPVPSATADELSEISPFPEHDSSVADLGLSDELDPSMDPSPWPAPPQSSAS